MKTMKNLFYNVGYQILFILVPLILAPYISRVVGPQGVGTYSYTYSVVTLFGMFINLGIAKYGNREIAECGNDRRQRSKVFAELMTAKLCCAVLVILAYLCYVYVSGGEYSEALLLQIFNLLSFLMDVSWVFWGMQEFRVTAAVSVGVSILTIFAIFGFVHTAADVNRYILILSVRALLIQSGAWCFLPRYIDLKPFLCRFESRHWKHLFLLFFPVFAKYLYSMMDRIMLGNMAGITEVGYYENVQSITITVITVITASGDVAMPKMTRLGREKDEESAGLLAAGMFHLVSYIGAGAVFGFIGVAGDFIPLFYGNAFLPCVRLLQNIAPVVLLAGYSDWIRNIFLLPRYRDREYVSALGGGAVVNLAVNSLLIGRMGNTGAVIGTLAAEFFVLVVQAWFVRKQIRIRYYLKTAMIYCLLGSIILIPCGIIRSLELPRLMAVLLEILAGGVVYTAGAGLYLYLGEKNLLLFLGRYWREGRKRWKKMG